MKLRITLPVLFSLLTFLGHALHGQQPLPKPESFEQKLSYAYGVQAARAFKQQQVPIDVKQFLQGFIAAAHGKGTALTEQEIGEIFQEYEKRLEERIAKPEHKIQLNAGYKFLIDQSTKEGVIKTPSGLLYQVITPGEGGSKPTLANKVSVAYKGSLVDGTVFEDSQGKQVTFPLANVIRGWQEGLQLMSVGSKYRFYIPHFLAYRDASPSEKIKPYSTLVFEIELLAIE